MLNHFEIMTGEKWEKNTVQEFWKPKFEIVMHLQNESKLCQTENLQNTWKNTATWQHNLLIRHRTCRGMVIQFAEIVKVIPNRKLKMQLKFEFPPETSKTNELKFLFFIWKTLPPSPPPSLPPSLLPEDEGRRSENKTLIS